MKLRLRILNGPLKNKFAPVKSGLILGRGPGTLALQDSKVSSRHAGVFQNKAGQWLLKDLGSTNGIKYRNRRVEQVLLSPGAEFYVGKTKIRVEALDADTPQLQDPAMAPTAAPEPAPEPEPEPPTWPEYFSSFMEKSRSKIKNQPKSLSPFPRILVLRILRGLQVAREWHVGYGPRQVGRGSLDFPIHDPSAPDVCFELIPDKTGVLIKTTHKNLVLLNDKGFSSESLKDGDLISFGDNLIEARFLETT